jgi:hypothetical protein
VEWYFGFEIEWNENYMDLGVFKKPAATDATSKYWSHSSEHKLAVSISCDSDRIIYY